MLKFVKKYLASGSKQSGISKVKFIIGIFVGLLIITSGLTAYRLHHKNSSASSQTANTSNNQPSAPTANNSGNKLDNCQTPNLTMSLGQPNGAAGTSYINIILTNTAGPSCQIEGAPAVMLTDSQGDLVGNPAGTNGSNAAPITLEPHKSVHATLGFPNPDSFSQGVCSSVSTYIKVTPPNQTTSFQYPIARQYCPGFSVSAFTSGT